MLASAFRAFNENFLEKSLSLSVHGGYLLQGTSWSAQLEEASVGISAPIFEICQYMFDCPQTGVSAEKEESEKDCLDTCHPMRSCFYTRENL